MAEGQDQKGLKAQTAHTKPAKSLSDQDRFIRLGQTGALIGLDLGTKTIGIAVCDPDRLVAAPVSVLRRRKFTVDIQSLIDTATSRQAVGFIMGLPLNMDGTEGPRAQSSRAFVRNAEKTTDLPFAFWDERLSTQAMERELIALDTSRANRSEKIDALAATFILQGAIDRWRRT
ncbi:MAG: Holliday junction resolvase RuvX [Pseudomonadota bacterium]